MATKVITLPIGNPDDARKLLKTWLEKDNVILFIVLGDTKIAIETVRRADILSGGDITEPQWVIYAEKREDVVEVLELLTDPSSFVTDWNKVLAVAVSLTDTIRDMIPRDGKIPTFSRINDAYMNAEFD